MASKKKLKQRIRWFEKAFQQLERERDDARFEWSMADAEETKALNSLWELEAATRRLLDAMGVIDGAVWPTLTPHIGELRRLLYGPDHPEGDDPAMHPVGWYRMMRPAWATRHFGFPPDPVAGDKHIASDGGEWTFELTGVGDWELSQYPPDELDAPVEAPNLRKAAEKPRVFERVESVVPVGKFGEPGTILHNEDGAA
ncbi:hypothetical protein [Nocardia flavorosea]|uniref:Uncharacterized protein n=1 Tax=Nocardia flavorosea TaxID=53429 RepID=A0A846YMV8_9NOCA|nr:hypothetical protein [Nocardia flavorosea]NKY60447.1 hypothetical protein [Nocardia flavorosea]